MKPKAHLPLTSVPLMDAIVALVSPLQAVLNSASSPVMDAFLEEGKN
ncbi:hypothetical protein [Acinetobacter terrestris]